MKTKLLIMSILSLLGIYASAGNDKIKYFEYNYHGSIGGDSFSIELKNSSDTTPATISLDYMQHRDYGKLSSDVSEAFIDSIEALCERYSIKQWDGFKEINREVLDGSGFSLYV